MEALAVLVAFGLVVCLAVVLHRRSAEEERQQAREEQQAKRAEAERIEGCSEVVRFFANHLGDIAREAVSREELRAWIDAGLSPEELVAEIWERCEAADGLTLGTHQAAGIPITVKLPPKYRSRHVYVVGKSGSGKTTLLRNLILQDLHAGHGLAVLAPEQELLTEELLPFIPEERWDDVIYVNPADTAYPVPLNPLHLDSGEDLDLKVDEVLTVFRRIFDEEGGGAAPRMETILRQALYTLMQVPGATLLDLEKLLERDDAAFRTRLLAQVRDPEARRFWTQTYPAYPKDAHLPLVNRLGRFLRPRVVRSILSSPGRSLNVRAAMDEGKVLLFNLSDGVLGEANAALLGQLIVAKLQMAAMSRADSPKAHRRPFTLYLDEFQTFCGVAATSYERILSRARKYGLGLVLAHQQTGQIPEPLMREILGNVSTVIAFQVGATDARRLGRELVGEVDGEPVPLEPRELLSLRVGEAWCKVGRSVFFLSTEPAPEGGSAAVCAEVIRRSRTRYGAGATEPEPATPDEVPARAGPRLEEIDPKEVF